MLRSHQANSPPLFRQIKFPTNITTAIAHGYAAFQHGGRDRARLPDYCLSPCQLPEDYRGRHGRLHPPEGLQA